MYYIDSFGFGFLYTFIEEDITGKIEKIRISVDLSKNHYKNIF